MQLKSTTPIGVTTDEPLMRDLEASQLAALLKGDFEDRGLCTHRTAERLAVLCVSILDPASYDAACWKAAERLYGFMDGRSDQTPLHEQNIHTRALYLTMAVNAFAMFRLALEGGLGAGLMADAYAHIQTHRNQLAARARTSFAVVEGGRDDSYGNR